MSGPQRGFTSRAQPPALVQKVSGRQREPGAAQALQYPDEVEWRSAPIAGPASHHPADCQPPDLAPATWQLAERGIWDEFREGVV